jgi:hypothetical protein
VPCRVTIHLSKIRNQLLDLRIEPVPALLRQPSQQSFILGATACIAARCETFNKSRP